MTDKTGWAAFLVHGGLPGDDPRNQILGGGLTIRDWFAGQALAQAVLDYGEPSGHPVTGQRKDRGNPVLPYASKGVGTREEIIARQAYRYADALLSARDEG